MTKSSWQDFGTHDESIVPELWDGVVGAWAPCFGSTGSRLHDHSRRANWGTLTNMDNATDWVISGGQYALDFDGLNDHIRMSDSVRFSGDQMSVSVWVYFNTVGNAVIVNQGSTTNQFILFHQSGWRVRGSSATEYTFGTTAVALRWIHVAFTAQGPSVTGYIDGVEQSPGTISPIAATLVTNLEFGSYVPFGGGFYLNGQIADVSIWNRALSANEVRQLHQLGRGGMYQRRRRRAIYLPQAGFQAAWARGSNVMLGFNQP